MSEEIESKILDIIELKKNIHYFDLAIQLGVGTETARRHALLLAKKHPKNLEYTRGLLRLTKPFVLDDLPPEKKIVALQETLETKAKIEKKLRKNHLPHLEKAILEGKLEKVREEFEKLKTLLEGKSE